MIFDVRSPVSTYIELNGYTIYVEVSEATENKPYVSCWNKDNPDKEEYWLEGGKKSND